jgi:hypothetical protein
VFPRPKKTSFFGKTPRSWSQNLVFETKFWEKETKGTSVFPRPKKTCFFGKTPLRFLGNKREWDQLRGPKIWFKNFPKIWFLNQILGKGKGKGNGKGNKMEIKRKTE